MGLEAVTFLSDLNATNPADTDLETQGAAHLRNIKKALLNTFPGGTRTVGVQRVSTKTSSYAVQQADAGTTFLIDTTGGQVNFVLPALGASDAGWEVQVIKVNAGLSPLLIFPTIGVLTSGNVTGLASSRRCIPGVPSRCLWTGTGFFLTRAGAAPVGTVLEYDGAALPIGFEWPNGQILTTGLYPDYFAVIGSGATLDRRGRVGAMNEQGTGRIGGVNTDTGAIFGSVHGSAGGSPTHAQLLGEMPNHNHPDSGHSHTDSGHSHSIPVAVASNAALSVAPGAVGAPANVATSGTTGVASAVISLGFANLAAAGGGAPMAIMQPTIIKNFILVVE